MNTSFASMQKTDRYNIIMYTKAVKTQPINLELYMFFCLPEKAADSITGELRVEAYNK